MPLWIKIAVTAFLCLLLPVYWRAYGATNFLWFSDIALMVTALALWLENRLLASMMTLGALIPECVWTANFIFGGTLFSGMEYLFAPQMSGYLLGLSLFHIAVPLILIWMLARLGYDRRALVAQTAFTWGLLPLTYVFSEPEENINWVFGFGNAPQTVMPGPLYLALWMLAVPVALFLPTHMLLGRLFGEKDDRRREGIAMED